MQLPAEIVRKYGATINPSGAERAVKMREIGVGTGRALSYPVGIQAVTDVSPTRVHAFKTNEGRGGTRGVFIFH